MLHKLKGHPYQGRVCIYLNIEYLVLGYGMVWWYGTIDSTSITWISTIPHHTVLCCVPVQYCCTGTGTGTGTKYYCGIVSCRAVLCCAGNLNPHITQPHTHKNSNQNTMVKEKFLLVGDVRGNLDVLTDRVRKLNDSGKGPFNVVLCVGEFSRRDLSSASFFRDVMEGREKLPFSLHFILSGTPSDAIFAEHHGLGSIPHDLSATVHYLGQAGVARIADLNVAYLSGFYDRDTYRAAAAAAAAEEPSDEASATKAAAPDAPPTTMFHSFYAKKHAEIILSRDLNEPIDLLLTCEWGLGWDSCLLSTETRPLAHRISPVVADLAKATRPRHHLASGQFCFHKLAPYSNVNNDGTTLTHPTRFVAVGPVPSSSSLTTGGSKPSKPPKWMHALSLEPMRNVHATERDAPLAGATASPYLVRLQRMVTGEGGQASNGGSGQRPSGHPPPLLGPLPSLGLDVARLSRESEWSARSHHQATRRGGVGHQPARHKRNRDEGRNSRRTRPVPPRMDCWFCVASPSCESHLIVSIGEHMYLTAPKGALSPGHMLIVPVSHDSSIADVSLEAAKEIESYKNSLRIFYAKHDEVPIFVERSITTKGPQHHTFIEAIPMPKDLATKLLPNAFSEEAKYHDMDFQLVESKTTLHEAASEDRQYFHIEMPSRIQLLYNVPINRKNKRRRNDGGSGMSGGGGGMSGSGGSGGSGGMSGSSGGRGEPPIGYVCKICNVPGHFIQHCSQASANIGNGNSSSNGSGSGMRSRGEIPTGYVCKLCNIPGHLIQDCSQASANIIKHKNQWASGGEIPTGYICKLCNVPGHFIQDCSLAKSNGSSGNSGSHGGSHRSGGHRVPLQFARKIVCRVLDCPERLHWKSCVVSPEVETKLANEFKAAFSSCDWTLQES